LAFKDRLWVRRVLLDDGVGEEQSPGEAIAKRLLVSTRGGHAVWADPGAVVKERVRDLMAYPKTLSMAGDRRPDRRRGGSPAARGFVVDPNAEAVAGPRRERRLQPRTRSAQAGVGNVKSACAAHGGDVI
jgi:hypothetical protein